MEKQRIQRYTKSCRRFLISFLLLSCTTLLSAQNSSRTISLEQIQSLRIIPTEEQKLYTKTDLKFSVTIPGVRPAQIQVLAADQKSDITFRSMRKLDNYDENGTTIELWYNFSKPGTFQLNPLSVMIQNRRRSLSFESITVTEDPASKYPRIVIVFEDGTRVYSDETNYSSPVLSVKTGRKLHFTVYLQYAIQLFQFNWDIPKDSIFTCTREYEFTEVRHRERVYTHDLIPVAAFEWTGLLPGLQSLPKFKLNAAGYNGSRSDLYLPDIQIEFKKNSLDESSESDNGIFSEAFYQEADTNEALEIVELSREDCKNLADLYSRESLAFLTYTKARKARLEFEKTHKIIATRNQIYPSVLLYISIILMILAIVFIIISLKKKHKIRSLIYTALLLIGLAGTIYCLFRRSEKYGISTGTKIYSIPQENAEASSEIRSGICVRILEKAGKWYYVEVGESGGWCSAENIFIIK